MKTTLLFLMLVFGTLAMYVDVENDVFSEDSDVEYLLSEIENSDGFSEMMGQQSQQIDDDYQFLPPTMSKKTATSSIATWNSLKTRKRNSMSMNSNSWEKTVSHQESQQAILSKAFSKVQKELTSSYQQNGRERRNRRFPPSLLPNCCDWTKDLFYLLTCFSF